jgi:hypothetical protein
MPKVVRFYDQCFNKHLKQKQSSKLNESTLPSSGENVVSDGENHLNKTVSINQDSSYNSSFYYPSSSSGAVSPIPFSSKKS